MVCRHYHRGKQAVCSGCRQLFAVIGPGCGICRLPLPAGSSVLCGLCLQKKPAFDVLYAHYLFEEPLRSLLHKFKYQETLNLGFLMAALMMEAYPRHAPRPDCLTAVPLHRQRLRQRGFNQSAILGHLLSKRIGVPFYPGLCEKITNTRTQARLSQSDRRQNLKGSFRIRENAFRHVILVDDLLTTGSTAHELAFALKHQGVSKVDAWCVARTP